MDVAIQSFRATRRTLDVLEWKSIQVALAERARTDFGREYCLGWVPGKLTQKAASAQARAVLELAEIKQESQAALPVSDIPDVSDVLRRVARSGAISVEEFSNLVRAHKAAQGLHHFLNRYTNTRPALLETLRGIDLIESWSSKHFPLLDAKGEIVDAASEDLRALRKLSGDLHRKIQDRLRDYLHNPKLAECMQEFYVTVRDGRYVVPVKTAFRSRVPGIIHDVSGTEATLFIEPQEVVDANNQLKVVEKEIEREIERILAQVVEDTKPHLEALRKNHDILARADLVSAASELIEAWGGDICAAEWVPGIKPEFTKLRHPVLSLRRKVVANSVGWNDGMVLSGPNTGGKTVLLKSVGCALCLAWGGFPIPAKEARFPADAAGISADIGDEQNLERNLSTFSAHLAVLKEILTTSQVGDLVLIDEIATGTSPEEGEPLAQAFLEQLLAKGVRFMVTTHYKGLKHFAMSDERVRIAAMAFDRITRTPTYEVILDVPGESSALETAEQLGLPADLIKRARELRGEVSEDLSKALGRLENARKGFDEREQELVRAKGKVDDEARRLRDKITEYEVKQREGLALEARDVLKSFTALREELASAVRAAAPQDLTAGATALFTKLSDAGDTVRTVIDEARRGENLSPSAADEDIVEGSILEIEGLGLGSVLETPKDPGNSRGVVLVQVGDIKTRVVRSRLRKPSNDRVRSFQTHKVANATARERIEKGATASTISRAGTSAGGGSLICDVRGKSVEEAMRRLETNLNELYRNEHGIITCIHGHGSDRLKDSIRDYLAKERSDLVYRSGSWPGEGGDGVTIIERRN